MSYLRSYSFNGLDHHAITSAMRTKLIRIRAFGVPSESVDAREIPHGTISFKIRRRFASGELLGTVGTVDTTPVNGSCAVTLIPVGEPVETRAAKDKSRRSGCCRGTESYRRRTCRKQSESIFAGMEGASAGAGDPLWVGARVRYHRGQVGGVLLQA